MTYTVEVKKIQDLLEVEKSEEDFCSYLFNLIKRQQAEISSKTEYIQEQRDVIDQLKAEIEWLEKARTKQGKRLSVERGQKYDLIDKISEIEKEKNEAINRIVEQLINEHRVVKTDEDCEWNRALYRAIEIVKAGGKNE